MFPDNSIDFEGKNLMSTFYNKSLKKVTLKSITKHWCSNSKNVKSNSYINSPKIHNDTTSNNFINTTYEVYLPLIDNAWEDDARKDGGGIWIVTTTVLQIRH